MFHNRKSIWRDTGGQNHITIASMRSSKQKKLSALFLAVVTYKQYNFCARCETGQCHLTLARSAEQFYFRLRACICTHHFVVFWAIQFVVFLQRGLST